MEEARFCPVCNRVVKGRTDKIYCSVNCKSQDHYERHLENERFYLKVSKHLRTNRKLLKKYNRSGYASVPCEELVGLGFNSKFFTHYWKNTKGEIYLFCFEFGFLSKLIRGKKRYVLVLWQDYMA